MIRGPETSQLIEKLSDAGVFETEAVEWLERVIAEQNAVVTHSCSCHVKNEGPCDVCKTLGCEVWNFNQVAMSEPDPRPYESWLGGDSDEERRSQRESVRKEFDELIKLPHFESWQSARLRHLKWHIDRGDVRCVCAGW